METAHEAISAMRAKIERRMNQLRMACGDKVFSGAEKRNMVVAYEELSRLLPLLDTLEAEQPVIKKSNALFEECLANVDPAIRKEVSDNIDKMLGRKPVERLEEEIKRFLSNATKMNKGEWRGKYSISDIGFRAVARHFYELGQCKKVDAPVDLEKAIHDWMLEIDGRYAILTHPPVDRVILETAKQFYDLGLNSKK